MSSRIQRTSLIELGNLSNMDRIKNMFKPRQDYEPIDSDTADTDGNSYVESDAGDVASSAPFSWIEYAIFILQGVAMLWAW